MIVDHLGIAWPSRTISSARPLQAAWIVVREVGLFAAVGLAAGIVIATAGSQAAATYLLGVKPNDIGALVVASIATALIVVLAALVPARHAPGVQPSITLKTDL